MLQNSRAQKLHQLQRDNYELRRENTELGKLVQELRSENGNYFNFISDSETQYRVMQDKIGSLMMEVTTLKEKLKEKAACLDRVRHEMETVLEHVTE